jgi:anionic cell wall polymer biosynthesis LytR-Cps2A-Psr (LCP) family protein
VSTVLAVMDRPGWGESTDNIVVAQPRRRRLVWVPRDLWAEGFGMRVNGVYAEAGAEGLLSALRALGVQAQHVICVQREATELLLAEVEVDVPVREPLRYWYPLTPQTLQKDGRKEVAFDPPAEHLAGERIHQWLGARIGVEGFGGGDLDRIVRQQAFVVALLSQGFSPRWLLEERPDLFRISSEPAVAELARVTPEWRMKTHGPLAPVTISGHQVLVRRRLRWPGIKRS